MNKPLFINVDLMTNSQLKTAVEDYVRTYNHIKQLEASLASLKDLLNLNPGDIYYSLSQNFKFKANKDNKPGVITKMKKEVIND